MNLSRGFNLTHLCDPKIAKCLSWPMSDHKKSNSTWLTLVISFDPKHILVEKCVRKSSISLRPNRQYLNLRNKQGEESTRARNLFYALWIFRLFMHYQCEAMRLHESTTYSMPTSHPFCPRKQEHMCVIWQCTYKIIVANLYVYVVHCLRVDWCPIKMSAIAKI